MKYAILQVLALTISTLSFAQHTYPIRWETKAVQTDHNIYEIHLKCILDSGYILYEPNRQNICEYSSTISFEPSSSWSALDGIDALSYERRHETGRCSTSGIPQVCNISSYEGSVTFMIVVRKEEPHAEQLVKGKIVSHAISIADGGTYHLITPFSISLSPIDNSSIKKCEEEPTKKEIRKANRQIKKMKKKYPHIYCPGFPPIL